GDRTFTFPKEFIISIHAPRVGVRLRQLVFLSFQNQHIDFTAILKSHFNTFLSVFKGFTYKKCANLPGILCLLGVRTACTSLILAFSPLLVLFNVRRWLLHG